MTLRALAGSITLTVALTLWMGSGPATTGAPTTSPPVKMWLPYGDGATAVCVQGPFSQGTHRGVHAWDFALAEGLPVVAAERGRVIRVVDNRHRTGINEFIESNAIFIDHGSGIYSTYLHHRAGTARVRPGQLVAEGSPLAEVGKVGTFTPHIHFDVRASSWHRTRDVHFRQGDHHVSRVEQRRAYPSATRPRTVPATFEDSRLTGDEFADNGVRLEGAGRAFWLPAGRSQTFRGQVSPLAREVVFFLWQDGRTSDYVARASPDKEGRFTLEVLIPRDCVGPHWYRITERDQQNRMLDVATLPVQVE